MKVDKTENLKKEKIIEKLTNVLEVVKTQLLNKSIPQLSIKSRNRNNVFQTEQGYWAIGDSKYINKTLSIPLRENFLLFCQRIM